MKEHPSLERFEDDDRRILEQADAMRRARRMAMFRRPLSKAARKALSFSDHELQEHLQVEDLTLISVMREHEAESLPEVIRKDEACRHDIQRAMAALREAVADDERLAPTMAELERCLRDYVAHQEKALLPYAADHLGDDLLTEADARFSEIYWTEEPKADAAPAAPAPQATVPS